MDARESWSRIVAWCNANTPTTAAAIRPPADAAILEQAVAATSGWWPDEPPHTRVGWSS